SAVLAWTLPASAANSITTTAVNMRVGAGGSYPRITTIPANAAVTVHGCVRNYTWCDTTYARYRGWVSARYLSALYQGTRRYLPDYGARIGVPIISFHFGNYWDRYYRDRPRYRNHHWYRDRSWQRERPRYRRDRDRNRDRDRRSNRRWKKN